MYDYSKERGIIETDDGKKMIDTIKKYVESVDEWQSEFDFFDFGREIGTYSSWELLACIDYLVEIGYLICSCNVGFRQRWKYKVKGR